MGGGPTVPTPTTTMKRGGVREVEPGDHRRAESDQPSAARWKSGDSGERAGRSNPRSDRHERRRRRRRRVPGRWRRARTGAREEVEEQRDAEQGKASAPARRASLEVWTLRGRSGGKGGAGARPRRLPRLAETAGCSLRRLPHVDRGGQGASADHENTQRQPSGPPTASAIHRPRRAHDGTVGAAMPTGANTRPRCDRLRWRASRCGSGSPVDPGARSARRAQPDAARRPSGCEHDDRPDAVEIGGTGAGAPVREACYQDRTDHEQRAPARRRSPSCVARATSAGCPAAPPPEPVRHIRRSARS